MTATTRSSAGHGWDLVRLAEVQPKALLPRVDSEIERGRREYRAPSVGDLIDASTLRTHQSPRNRARFERLSDYVLPGDSVIEVGCGWGLVGARVLAAGAGAYRAMDIEAELVDRATQVLRTLGHEDRIGPITQKDLYTLTPPDLADASLIICSEVIEHVPDPEAALESIARAMPPGAELLFSVPLLGKLEKVWGHVSIFTVDRLRTMLERAGLEAHHVEPLVNQWVLVLAGPAGGASQGLDVRLAQVRAGAAQHPAVALPEEVTPVPPQPRRFDNVSLSSLEPSAARHGPNGRTKIVITDASDTHDAIRVDVAARRWLGPKEPVALGTCIPLDEVGPVEGVRIAFEIDDVTNVTEVTVAFRRPDSSVAGQWRWRPGERAREKKAASHTVSLRPGAHRPPFAGPKSAAVPEADRMEMTLTVTPGSRARLSITRLGWIR